MLQNARVTAFIVSELLMANQQEGKITPLPTRLVLKFFYVSIIKKMRFIVSVKLNLIERKLRKTLRKSQSIL